VTQEGVLLLRFQRDLLYNSRFETLNTTDIFIEFEDSKKKDNLKTWYFVSLDKDLMKIQLLFKGDVSED